MGRHFKKITDFQLLLDNCFLETSAANPAAAGQLKQAYLQHLEDFVKGILCAEKPVHPKKAAIAANLLNALGITTSAENLLHQLFDYPVTLVGPGSAEVPVYFENLIRYDTVPGHRIVSSRLAVALFLLASQEIMDASLDEMLHSLDPVVRTVYSFVSEQLCRINDYLDSRGIAACTFQAPVFPSAGADEPFRLETPPAFPASPTPAAPEVSTGAPNGNPSLPRMEDVLAELDELIGIAAVKKEVRSLINLVQVRQMRAKMGLPEPPLSLHLVFTGNPGTGKTTVARLLAKLFHALGLLKKGHLVEVDRAGLVAGYVGQTALKVQEVIASAIGGVLFIDEAYALVAGRGETDFGTEAVDILLKGMEDHRDNLIVIVAGYQEPMEQFLQCNPGIRSRFNRYIHFEDYTPGELVEIFHRMSQKHGYYPDEAANQRLLAIFEQLCATKKEHFANARTVRNFLEQTITSQANRVVSLPNPSKETISAILVQDLPAPEKS